jgi:hypothetical protein
LIAGYLCRDGWQKKDCSAIADILRPVDIRGKYVDTVQTRDIPQILEAAEDALTFYFRYKNLGNPFAPRGWLYWPEWALDIISLYNSIDWSHDPRWSSE